MNILQLMNWTQGSLNIDQLMVICQIFEFFCYLMIPTISVNCGRVLYSRF